MAQGQITQLGPHVASIVDEAKTTYAHIRRLMDRLIILKGDGSNYAALEAATGAAAGTGATVFDNCDAALGGATTMNNALSNMDINAT